MYRIAVKSHFSAAHRLRGYQGECEDLHGHNWKIEAVVAAVDLNRIGVVIDFKELKGKLSEVLGLLDHKYLNELNHFKKVNPTSENIARFIYDKLNLNPAPEKSWCGVKLISVTVWETDTSCATYQE